MSRVALEVGMKRTSGDNHWSSFCITIFSVTEWSILSIVFASIILRMEREILNFMKRIVVWYCYLSNSLST